MPTTTKNQPRRRQDGPEEVELRLGALHAWVGDASCQVEDDQDKQRLHAKGQAPGGGTGDQATDERPGRRADAARGADGAEARARAT